MSAEDPGCQHSAGILENGKLSKTAKARIIQNIIDDGQIGFDKVHPELPCAKDLGIPLIKGLVPNDLFDEQKYPDFHKNVIGNFEQIALKLDIKGGYMIPPIIDPFSLGVKLGLDVSFDLLDLPTLTPPTLALALNIKIPDLLKILVTLKPPKFPPFEIPSLEIPSVNIPDPPFLDLFLFLAWPKSLLDLILKLAIPDVNFVLGMLQVPPNLCPVIKTVADAKLFGPTTPGDIAKIITLAELSTFTAQCATIAVTSMIVGDGGPTGISGNLGTQYGFRSAVPVGDGPDGKARNTMIEAFKQEFNRDPTLKEVQFAQLIGKMENGYGTAWAGSKNSWPSQAKNSNNWGNIHGRGDAGSFQHIDYDAKGNEYSTSYAMYSSPVAGARALLRQLYVKRPYILHAINNDKSLYKPIYLMSSQAVYGKNKKAPASSDAVIPPSSGGLTYYEASPEIYLKNARAGLKLIMKNLKEETDFDVEAKSNLPYSSEEADDSKNMGSGSIPKDVN